MAPPTDLAGVVRRFYQALSARDIDTVEQMSSDDDGAVAIGTDPDEWWEGGREITAVLRRYLVEAQLTIEPGQPRIGQTGEVAWFADRPTFATPEGREIACRLTGVLRREDGEWRIGVP
jgi:ketosteroid isomerase-like protein